MSSKCMKDEVIYGYIVNVLSEEERMEAEAHLAECDSCLQVLVACRELVRADVLEGLEPVPGEVTDRALAACRNSGKRSLLREGSHTLVARVKEGLERAREAFVAGGLSSVPVRGTKGLLTVEPVPILGEVSGVRLEMEIQDLGGEKVNIWIQARPDHFEKNPTRVSLFREEREVSSCLLKDDTVLFEEMPFASYTLVCFREGVRVGEYSFEIKENQHG